MRRVAAVLVTLIAVAALAAVSYASGLIPGTERCVWRSVDKGSYVAENDAVFATIRLPDYLREATTNTYSVGIPAMDSCLPNENGAPYEAYVTWHVFIQPLGQYPRGYDRRLLDPNGSPRTEACPANPSAVDRPPSTSRRPTKQRRSQSTTAATTANQT